MIVGPVLDGSRVFNCTRSRHWSRRDMRNSWRWGSHIPSSFSYISLRHYDEPLAHNYNRTPPLRNRRKSSRTRWSRNCSVGGVRYRIDESDVVSVPIPAKELGKDADRKAQWRWNWWRIAWIYSSGSRRLPMGVRTWEIYCAQVCIWFFGMGVTSSADRFGFDRQCKLWHSQMFQWYTRRNSSAGYRQNLVSTFATCFTFVCSRTLLLDIHIALPTSSSL